MQFPVSLALSLALAAQAGANAEGQVPFNRPLPVPLYEEYPVVQDFRLNQAVEGAIRWTSLGLILGGMAAASLLPHDALGIVPVLGAAAGGLAGLGAGATVGYFRGRDWERRKARGESPHARRRQVGYELDFGQGLGRQDNNRECHHFALAWRLPVLQSWAPDEYQLRFGSQSWFADDRFENHAREDRRGLRAVKSFRDALVNPFVGVGAGYSRGTSFDYTLASPTEAPGIAFETAYAEALAGIELNAFDFFQAKLLAAYEPFGPYRLISRHGDYDYRSNFTLHVTFGTRLF